MFVINKDCTCKGTISLLVSHRMSDTFWYQILYRSSYPTPAECVLRLCWMRI